MEKRIINLNRILKIAAEILLTLIFVFSVGGLIGFASPFNQATTAHAAENATEFAGGDGSEQNPFLIATEKQLDEVRKYTARYGYDGVTYTGKHFKLTRDIDLTGYLSEGGDGYNGGKGWEPIGSFEDSPNMISDDFFSGSFDGGKFTVTGLWMNRPDEDAVGFFGNIKNASVKNLNIVLADVGITGGFSAKPTQSMGHTGALAGFAASSSIEKCSVTGNVTAVGNAYGGMYVLGGLVGFINNSIVSECLFDGKATYIPSNAADAEGIEFCGVGGVAGWVAYGSEIKNCFVRVEITGSEDYPEYTGGLAGTYVSSTKAETCFVALTGGKAYPFFGNKVLPATQPVITDCYYYGETEAIFEFDKNYHFEGSTFSRLAIDELGDKPSFTGFDFENTWGFDKEGNLVLKAFGKAYYPPDLTWLWILLGCTLFGAAAIFGGLMLYRRKKTETVTVTNTVTKTVERVVEVPMIKRALPPDLSEQERCVAQYILKGKSRRQIAEIMGITDGTVKSYVSRLYQKAGVDNQNEFIARYLGGEE